MLQAEMKENPIAIKEFDTSQVEDTGDGEIFDTEDNEIIDLKSIQEAEAQARENAVQKAIQQAEEKRIKPLSQRRRPDYIVNQAEQLRLATESVRLDEVKMRQKNKGRLPQGDPSPALLVPRLSDINIEDTIGNYFMVPTM